MNGAYLIPAGFKAVEAASNLVSLQGIWFCAEYEELDESGINTEQSEDDTQKVISEKNHCDLHCVVFLEKELNQRGERELTVGPAVVRV